MLTEPTVDGKSVLTTYIRDFEKEVAIFEKHGAE